MMRQELANSYLFGANAPFIEELYERYLENPGAVEPAWRDYFDKLGALPGPGHATAPDVAHAPVVASFAQRAKEGTLKEAGAEPAQRKAGSGPATDQRLSVSRQPLGAAGSAQAL